MHVVVERPTVSACVGLLSAVTYHSEQSPDHARNITARTHVCTCTEPPQ